MYSTLDPTERTPSRVLIGYLFQEYPDSALLETIEPEWFKPSTPGTIFEWLRNKNRKSKPVDLILAINELSPDQVRYVMAAIDCYMDSGLMVSEVRKECIQVLREQWAEGELRRLAYQGFNGDEDRRKFAELANEAEIGFKTFWKTSADLVDDVLADISKRLQAGPFLPTSYQKLDELTDGLHPGELWTVGAYTAVGKTVFLTSIAHRLLSRGVKILYLTTEMQDAEYLKQRLLPVYSDVHSEAIRKRTVTPDELIRLTAGGEQLKRAPLSISDLANPSLADIRALADGVKPRALFVDHLHRCAIPKAETKNQGFSEFMLGLKTIARQKEIPIIAAAQFNRASLATPDPTMSSLRDSGSLEMESDVVILLSRERKKNMFTGRMEVSDIVKAEVAKNRHGPVGWFDLKLSTREMLLIETDT